MRVNKTSVKILKQNLHGAHKVASGFFETQTPTIYYFSDRENFHIPSILEGEVLKNIITEQLNSHYENSFNVAVKGELSLSYPQMQEAKREYVKKLFLKKNGHVLEGINYARKNALLSAENFLVAAQQMSQNTFVDQVITALETKTQTAHTQQEFVAQTLVEDYVFGAEHVNIAAAKLEALQNTFEHAYQSTTALENVARTWNALLPQLNYTIIAPKGVVDSSLFVEVYDNFTKRLEYYNEELFGKYATDFQNRVLAQARKVVFEKSPQHQRENEVARLPYSVNWVLSNYGQELFLMLNNAAAIKKIDNDLVVFEKLNKNNYNINTGAKQAEKNFYFTVNEMLFSSVYQKEKQRVIKNVIGESTTNLLLENEQFLCQNRGNTMSPILLEFLPLATAESVSDLLEKSRTLNFKETLKNLENNITNYVANFNLQNINAGEYSRKVCNAAFIAVDNNEANEVSYFTQYLANISSIKQEMNAARFAEFSVIANNLWVNDQIFEKNYEKIMNIDSNLISPQEKNLLLYKNIADKTLAEINTKMDAIASIYNTSQEKLESFTISFIGGIVPHIASEKNAQVRKNYLLAYSLPLSKNGIIKSFGELEHVVEVLCKRSDANYVKINNEMAKNETQINWHEFKNLPLGGATASLDEGEIKNANVLQSANEQTFESVGETNPLENQVMVEEVGQETHETKKTDNQEITKEEKQEVHETAEEEKQEVHETAEEEKQEVNADEKQNSPQKQRNNEKIEDKFSQLKEANITSIDHDAKTYAFFEAQKQKLSSINALSDSERQELFNSLTQNLPAPALNTENVQEKAAAWEEVVSAKNSEIISKYSKLNYDEKVAFVVLAINNQQENAQTFDNMKEEASAKVYDLADQKQFNSCKNDMFWKMQLMAVKKNVNLNESLNDESMEEFNKVAPVVKLFEIAANEHSELSDITIANIGQLNYQQLARVSILKYKDGKINDPETVNLVSHIMTNTLVYSKTTEYLNVVENILKRDDVAAKLEKGTISIDKLIENELVNNNEFSEVLNNFYLKTAPAAPKLIKNDEFLEENDNITI